MPLIRIASTAHSQMIDITREVQSHVSASGISSGLVHICSMHTTGAITVNENADPAVTEDIMTFMDHLIPWKGPFKHLEGNSAAHIKTSLFGPSQTLAIENHELVLGTWQGIFFCEFDGPRNRKIHLSLIDSGA